MSYFIAKICKSFKVDLSERNGEWASLNFLNYLIFFQSLNVSFVKFPLVTFSNAKYFFHSIDPGKMQRNIFLDNIFSLADLKDAL